MDDYMIPMVVTPGEGGLPVKSVDVKLGDAMQLIGRGTHFPWRKYFELMQQGVPESEIIEKYLPIIARLVRERQDLIDRTYGKPTGGVEIDGLTGIIRLDATQPFGTALRSDELDALLSGLDAPGTDPVENFCRQALEYVRNYKADEAAAVAGE